jgi:hypothetical protein
MPDAESARRARDLVVIANPRLWRTWPFLPVVRAPPGGEKELGVLYDARHVSGQYGYSATVFLANLFMLPRTERALLDMPRCVYDTFEELLADGWTID